MGELSEHRKAALKARLIVAEAKVQRAEAGLDPDGAVILLENGDMEFIEPPDSDKTLTLQQLQHTVGGYIEILQVFDSRDCLLIVNENPEGKSSVNQMATLACGFATIWGNALICPTDLVE